MHDHYIACVVIIFVALLATIPTYHEMQRAETPGGSTLPPRIFAGEFAGASSDPAADQSHLLARVTVWPGGKRSPHAKPGAGLLTVKPGPLERTLAASSADVARGAGISAIDLRTTHDGLTRARLAREAAIVTK